MIGRTSAAKRSAPAAWDCLPSAAAWPALRGLPSRFRRNLRASGTTPVIPGRRTRKRPRHEASRYKDRWRIEAAFCRLKDFRRIATRYDKLAANFASAVALASIVSFWC